MDIIHEKLETPVVSHYQVVVAGGGPAGYASALAAARRGMKTLLIERNSFLGGMWTAGLVNPMFDTDYKGGMIRELVNTLKEEKAFGGFEGFCFDPEILKVVLEQKLVSAGVQILYCAEVCQVIKSGHRVEGVVVHTKGGRRAYRSEIVIDCTGDGDVAAFAGAEVMIGREGDGAVQPMTLMFKLSHVRFMQKDCDEFYALLRKAVEEQHPEYRIPYTRPYVIQLPETDAAVVQMVHVKNKTALSPEDMSEACLEARLAVLQAVRVMRSIPAFKDIVLEQTGSVMGVRETRRIRGEYLLTAEDLLSGRHFPDGTGLCGFPVDIHCPDSEDQDIRQVRLYHIPFRCQIPLGLEGILTAGRCISGTHEAHASYRVTGNCMAMGEAAGTAAALCLSNNLTPRQLPHHQLAEALVSQGVIME